MATRVRTAGWPREGTHGRTVLRSPAVHPSGGTTDWVRVTAIPGQLAYSSGVQRARFADEPGGERRPVSKANRSDGKDGVRNRRAAICRVAANASAVLSEPGGPGEVAAAAADRHD